MNVEVLKPVPVAWYRIYCASECEDYEECGYADVLRLVDDVHIVEIFLVYMPVLVRFYVRGTVTEDDIKTLINKVKRIPRVQVRRVQ